MATAAVQPERILKDLAKLWIDLGKEDSQKGSAGVLRACAMTLIAAVDQQSDAQAASETIADLMHQHPSRVIVMRVAPDANSDLEARVFAQCWMPFGRRQQICCEQIEITASEGRVDDLPKFVLGLMVPDLPVVLWCRSERLARDPAFQNLFPLSHKIILDSSSFADSSAALTFIRELIAAGRNVADLTWTRLTRLRATIAQVFENDRALAQLKTLQKVTLTYGGPAPLNPESVPACLQYLIAWFRSTLAVPIETVHQPTPGSYDIIGIELTGPELHTSIALHDGAAEIRVGDLVRRTSFPKLSDCDLMREELSILSVDTIYRRCLG